MDELLNRLPSDADVTNRTCNHKCSCCGSCCCEFIPITKKEVSVIKEYLSKHPEIKGNWLSYETGKNIYCFCPFLTKENKCSIYSVRPFVCRDFKCDRNIKLIKSKREAYALRADYNAFIKNVPTVSWHLLFFDDYGFDLAYRHLVIKKFFNKDVSIEEEKLVLPMYVDSYLLKKGGK